MCIFAFLSEIPFDVVFFSKYSIFEGTYPLYWGYQNIFFTLTLALLTLYGIEKIRNTQSIIVNKWICIIAQLALVTSASFFAELIKSDYGSQGILYIIGFNLCRKSRTLQVITFLLIYIATTGNQPTLFILASCLSILLYNGKRGKLQMKYFFYIFYPLHIIALYALTLLA